MNKNNFLFGIVIGLIAGLAIGFSPPTALTEILN
jgi:hypothetical protein